MRNKVKNTFPRPDHNPVKNEDPNNQLELEQF